MFTVCPKDTLDIESEHMMQVRTNLAIVLDICEEYAKVNYCGSIPTQARIAGYVGL